MTHSVSNQRSSGLADQIRNHWRLLALAIVLATVAQAAGIPLVLLIRRLVDVASAGQGAGAEDIARLQQTVLMFAVLLAGLALVRGACRWIQGVISERFAQRVIAGVRLQMLEHLQRLPLGYFDRRAAGKVIIRFVGDATGLRGWLANTLVKTPADILTILGIAVTLGLINWRLLVAAAAPPILLSPLIMICNPALRKLTRNGRREQSRLTGDLTDRLDAIDAIKSAGAESSSLHRLSARVIEISNIFTRRGGLDAWCRGVALTAGSLSICAIGYWGAIMVMGGQGTIGDILAAVWFAVLIRGPLNRLSSASLAYQRFVVTADRIDALLSRQPEPGFDDDLLPFTGEARRIRFKDLGYRDHQDRWIVRGMTGTIVGPGCIAITGRGTATDTVFELLQRLRRPHEGRVALDHVNARKLRVNDIRNAIGWVDRSRNIIPVTLAAPVDDRIFRAWAATESIAPHAPLGTLDDAINAGFDRWPVTGSLGLRLAITCALINDPPTLLISNPTEGLDDVEIEDLTNWLRHESEHRLILIDGVDPRIRTIARSTFWIDDFVSTVDTTLSMNGASTTLLREAVTCINGK